MEEKLSVILVNYNGKAYNDKCIKSIFRSRIREELEIVIVDNASKDNSLTELKRNWGNDKRIHILPLDRNYGFSKANNEGIKWALNGGSKYFLLLNNDTEIESDTIEKMLSDYKMTKSIVVPKVLYADRRDVIWCAGGSFSGIIKKARQRGLNEADKGQFDESGFCDFANGCCMLLSDKIIEKSGFLDERFFLYYEDTEYSLRAKEKDISIRYCAKAKVYHKVNGSTRGNEKPDNAYYITRNWLLCNKMHMGKGRFSMFCLYFLLNRLAWAVIWCIQGKKDMAREIYRGIKDFRNGRYGKYEKRILHSL